jgi:hypothetical protein
VRRSLFLPWGVRSAALIRLVSWQDRQGFGEAGAPVACAPSTSTAGEPWSWLALSPVEAAIVIPATIVGRTPPAARMIQRARHERLVCSGTTLFISAERMQPSPVAAPA